MYSDSLQHIALKKKRESSQTHCEIHKSQMHSTKSHAGNSQPLSHELVQDMEPKP